MFISIINVLIFSAFRSRFKDTWKLWLAIRIVKPWKVMTGSYDNLRSLLLKQWSCWLKENKVQINRYSGVSSENNHYLREQQVLSFFDFTWGQQICWNKVKRMKQYNTVLATATCCWIIQGTYCHEMKRSTWQCEPHSTNCANVKNGSKTSFFFKQTMNKTYIHINIYFWKQTSTFKFKLLYPIIVSRPKAWTWDTLKISGTYGKMQSIIQTTS